MSSYPRSVSPAPSSPTSKIRMMDDQGHCGQGSVSVTPSQEGEPKVPPRTRRGRSLSVNRLSMTVQTSIDSEEPNQFNMVHNNFGYDRG